MSVCWVPELYRERCGCHCAWDEPALESFLAPAWLLPSVSARPPHLLPEAGEQLRPGPGDTTARAIEEAVCSTMCANLAL